MQRMTGIILMVAGSLILIVGIFLFVKSPSESTLSNNTNELADVSVPVISNKNTANNVIDKPNDESVRTSSISNSDREKVIYREEAISQQSSSTENQRSDSKEGLVDESKQKGEDFEKFVVQKFNKNYFNIKEWAGDKYVDGRYAETTLQPDLVLELNLNSRSATFAVECKWRKGAYKNKVDIATSDQLKRYKKFQTDKNIPVFIVIGIGGQASSPRDLYVIPLDDIKYESVYLDKLNNYKKETDDKFYFDIKTNVLS